MPSLATLNALDRQALAAALHPCCGARRWVDAMLAARPFATATDLFAAADRAWQALEPADWREAFAHHPRIGAVPTGPAAQGAPSAAMPAKMTPPDAWSRQEQRGVESATAGVREALARGNVAYEQRFGWIFLICATGKSAAEMLAALQQRLSNDPETELRVAASEHARITRLRLEKLLQA